ncbi:histidine kinase [Sphaerisporangium flaviroseum]|uniref:histidine kinase n=2 Tax=Sphaerisporangium flaviroseum TaxID=509199 RepID=A0ABP7J5G7_9ACTN
MPEGRAPPYILTVATPAVLNDEIPLPAGLVSGPDPDEVRLTGRSVRDWVVDVLCFLLAIAFTVLTLIDSIEQHLPPVPFAVDLILGGLSCLGMWLRRRWPVGLAVIVGLFSIYSMSAAGVAMIALFTVAVHRRFAVVGPITAGYALTSSVSLLVRPDVSVSHWSQVVLGVACAAAVLAWGMFVRARRQQLVAARRERVRRAVAEQELRVAQARQAERNRIAREMHDVLAHRLSLLSLHAGALELRPGAPPDEVARAAGVIRESAYQALEDLREVIGVLRADRVDVDGADEPPDRPQPTLVDLPELVDQSRRVGMRVRLECQVSDPTAAPAAIGRSAYRIVQEGLTNARKHARDAEVSVAVHGSAGDGLTVEIRNPCLVSAADTAGIPGGGAGLIGLSERTGLAGGRLEHGRTPAGDFRLWAWLPWPT